MRLLAFVSAFLGLLGVQLVWEPGHGALTAAPRCRPCAEQRHAQVKRPAPLSGRVRGETRVCRAGFAPAAR